MKLILSKPIPLDKLRDKLRRLNVQVTPKRDQWLRRHHDHGNLQLESHRFYCRTCKETE